MVMTLTRRKERRAQEWGGGESIIINVSFSLFLILLLFMLT